MVCWLDRYFGAVPNPLGSGFLLSVVWSLVFWLCSPVALAAETQWQWQGAQGYQVQAHLTYPVSTGMVAIEGKGKPQNLQALTVQVYDPNGEKLAVYENVIAGQPGQDDFLQLHFDVAQQQLRGWLDVGGAVRGDYFLKGQAGLSLDLFYLDAQGKETKVDHNDGQVSLVTD